MLDARPLPNPWKDVAEKAVYCVSRFDFDFIPEIVVAMESDPTLPFEKRRVGWAHPHSNETGGPAIGVKLDPALLDPHKDYLGRPLGYKSKHTQWATSVVLHEMFHLVDEFDPNIKQQLVQRYGIDDHDWIPIALRAYTPLYIPEVPTWKAKKIREILG